MAGIPQNILDDIINKVDIVEVISSYIPLKKAGRNFRAVCPFHHEKTPSFMVSSDKQIYHCFGCGAGGNVFNFLMRYERLEFPEAVEAMARKAGVALPKFHSAETRKIESLSSQLHNINALAAEFYHKNIFSDAGGSARAYLHKRGITDENIKQFNLGFAPDKWDGLINFLRAGGISVSLIEKAGLAVSKSDKMGFYDRFRNRIIFPIYEIRGRVIGFGARTMDKEVTPKYINSPETQVYIKGKHLFGLNLSKEPIGTADYVAIVEGYLDFITPYINGFTSIAASLGTALTTDQIRLIKRYTHNVVMVYDADKAGELAALRSLDLLIEEDLNVKVVSLGDELDPDSFIRKNGISAFRKKIDTAQTLFDYKLGLLYRRYNRETIEDRAKIAKEMLFTINKIKNEIVKSEYVKRLASELRVKEESLRLELKNAKDKNAGFRGFELNSQKFKAAAGQLEKMLVGLAMEDKESLNKLRDNLKPSDFKDGRLNELVGIMFELGSQGIEDVCASALINRCGDSSAAELVSELCACVLDVHSDDKERVLNDCIERLKSERLKARRVAIQEELKAAEGRSDETKISQLMEEFRGLTLRQRSGLTKSGGIK
ncbi:MAG: DNA primase [Candidatus Omnitrophica bacterium]|nr:DNA primase [Candidatus Omnitrophota bacterium]